MASLGRCAGCGDSGPHRKISAHVMSCVKYQELYAADPAKALQPLEEFARWEREDKVCGHEARKERIVAARTATLKLQAARLARFDHLPDILEG